MYSVPILLYLGLWDLINIYIGIRGAASQNSVKHLKTDIPFVWFLGGITSPNMGFTRNCSYFLSYFSGSCKTRRKILRVPIEQN